MKKLVFVIAIFAFSIHASNAQSKEEKLVATAVETLKKAMLDGKKDELEAITAPELTYGHSSGKMENRKEFVTALATGTSDFVTIELSNQSISVVGNTALVRHNLNGTNKDGGVPGVVKLGVLLVWQKQKGSWKLLARQAFKLP